MPFRKLLNSLTQEIQSGLQGAAGGSSGNGYGFGGYGGSGMRTGALEHYDDPGTMAILQQIAGCAVTSGFMRRPDMSALLNGLRANLPPPRGPGAGTSAGVPGVFGAPPLPSGLCPRDYPFTSLRCHTMEGLFNFTVCEQCYKEVIEPDVRQGVELARRVDQTPAVMGGPGFTCQLYSDRMRRVWKEAVSMGEPMGLEHLGAKVTERKAKKRELQMKTAQLQQQAVSLCIGAQTKEHMAANLNNQAAMLKVQADQAEDRTRMAQEEWRRFWE
ncbi:hypothetical protein B0T09DRAFT_359154 [Sordaria sp. MPI-SDFR-AT-0083]|nr:hypothetical protein B0T09DRAFT_359154 [Sordaria sp. MPI-SDFR-AT-0083]